MSNTNTATAAYRRLYAKIDAACMEIPLLIEPGIAESKGNVITWADVGSLTHVADLLQQAIGFLKGTED